MNVHSMLLHTASSLAQSQQFVSCKAWTQSTRGCVCSLAGKLRTAQVTRERSLQLQERVLHDAQERELAALTAERLERDRITALAAEEDKQMARRLDNFKARDQLEVRPLKTHVRTSV
jgi:hypothetical protein